MPPRKSSDVVEKKPAAKPEAKAPERDSSKDELVIEIASALYCGSIPNLMNPQVKFDAVADKSIEAAEIFAESVKNKGY